VAWRHRLPAWQLYRRSLKQSLKRWCTSRVPGVTTKCPSSPNTTNGGSAFSSVQAASTYGKPSRPKTERRIERSSASFQRRARELCAVCRADLTQGSAPGLRSEPHQTMPRYHEICRVQSGTARRETHAISYGSSSGHDRIIEIREEGTVNILVLLIVLVLLFGGGGFYLGGPALGGGLGGLILLVLIVMLATGRIGSRA
jgi:hypothetical protein